MNTNARSLAFESLKKCTKDGKYSNLEVLSSLSRVNLDPRDKALYTALVYGVIEKGITLDHVLSDYSRIPLEDLDVGALVSLRLGLYQILFMDRVPDHSACDEAVKLVPKSAKSFVNGVLRAILREKDEVIKSIETAPLSVKYSVPQWMISIWQDGYGEEKTLEILKGFESRPPMTLRVNTLKITADELLCHIDGKPHPIHSDMIYAAGNAEGLYGYAEGLFFVQGTNSRTAVKALGLQAGETVIDTCACPGGKSFSAAIDMKNQGRIYSFDLHSNKLSLITRGAKRLGIDIITADTCNAASPCEELLGSADAVICDVPCSGLGIIAKKPDIKYKNYSDVERLPKIQAEILSASSGYLKSGGRLLYSTCTLNPEENERITEEFLKEHKNFRRAEGYPVTAFPSDDSDDGFFYDLLIKD